METLTLELITYVSSFQRYIFSRSPCNVFVAQWVESCYPTRYTEGPWFVSHCGDMFASFYLFSQFR